ncbi:MAG: ShlB/FhaC/HecB family hemolysin secretion/activation protein [Vitreoscilla sp.]|nr:ShlB/FhaC/HecB family hemolysin secretion/activation protein [Polaromonas sp.]
MPAPSFSPPGAPRLVLPDAKPAPPADAAVRITPSAFRFTGNSLFSSGQLAELLANLVDQPTTLAGLTAAASTVAAYYRSQGYLLTEAYLPEQAFAATGGTVTIRIIEAKIGRALIELDGGGQSAGKTFVEELLASHLKKGADVTEYALDKPVLLLRDLAGHDATATVEPGNDTGEVNVRVSVTSKGLYADGAVMLDNHGASAAGAVRAMATANVNNLMGRGDVLSIGGQISDQPGSNFYRLGYVLPVGGQGTRLSANTARLNYALGKQFAALGATGKADILSLGLSHPLIRGRNANLYAQVNAEQKRLTDDTASPVLRSERDISSLRAGLSGNFTDNLTGRLGLNSYGVNITSGQLKLSPADLAVDEGVGGLRTAGAFSKINLDYQRTQYLPGAASLHFIGQAQWASKNLGSAEKLSLGGPNGVRAYPVGEGLGDSGALFSLEYRYLLPAAMLPFGEPLSLVTFYDYGHVRVNQNGPGVPGAANSKTLGAVGVGAILGRSGNFLIKTHLAWRTTGTSPTTGDADAAPRAWLSAQSWF